MDGSTEERILDAQLELFGNDVEAVRRAANELASIGVDALPTLIAALDEPRAAQHVHQAVLDAIEYFKLGVVAAPAIPSIMRYLNPDILHGGCTVEAACALASIGEPAVQPALKRFRIAKSEERKSFFMAFTRLECTLVAAPLIELLNESDGDLRLHLCQLIPYVCRYNHRESAVAELSKLFGDASQTDPYVRAAAGSALARFEHEGFEELHKHIRSPDEGVRAAAYQAIVECVKLSPDLIGGERTCVPTLLSDASRFDINNTARMAAVAAFHELAESRARSLLIELMDEGNSEDQIVATQSLLKRGLRPYSHMLDLFEERAINDPSLRLRRITAAAVLVGNEACDERIFDILRRAIHDPEDTDRDKYLRAMQIAGAWSAPLLPDIGFLIRPRDRLALLAIETVESIGVTTEEIIECLLNYIARGDDHSARSAAVKCVGRLASGNSQVIAVLVAQLNDSGIEAAACIALGRMGKHAASAVDAIEQAVHLSCLIPEALRRIGTPEAIRAIWRLYDIGNEGYGDIGRTDAQDLYDRAHAELCRLGEIKLKKFE